MNVASAFLEKQLIATKKLEKTILITNDLAYMQGLREVC